MFLDSKIALKMELGKDKLLKYVVSCRIAPFRKSQWITVACCLLQENLNKVIQEFEMDLVLKFWDTCKDKVQIR